jgi:peptidoglycan/xylan/chitin deacetylase (PgdA/CDA1 family)
MRPDRLVRHPLVVIPLVAAVLTVAWLRYAGDQGGASQATRGANLLTAGAAADDGGPRGWRLDHSGEAQVSLRTVPGHVTDRARQLDVAGYVSGDVTLTSPRVPVSGDQRYLFKAYYSNGPAFTLLARYFHRDGTDRLVALQDVPAGTRTWATVADAFDAGSTTTAVQYVFRLSAPGTLQVDGSYLEANRDVYVAPAPPAGPNLIPNPALTPTADGRPAPWTTYRAGSSTTVFRTGHDGDGNYLETRIAGYEGGEAKWQYPPLPVHPDQYLAFTATYRSDLPVDVVAEFELAGGGRRFANLATVPTATAWTQVTEHVQVPDGAAAMMLTLVSHGDGTTGVRDYSLVDVTRPGAPRWNRPLVSLTFDDGWESACDNAVPLLDQYGYKGTFYGDASTIETPRFMTAADLAALHRAGHEIAAHGYQDTDLTVLRADRINGQLERGWEPLARAGVGTSDLATPLGRSDPQVQQYAREYYRSVRGLQPGINTRQNLDPYDLRVFYVDSTTAPAALAAALEETRRANGWLILVYHEITGAPSATDDRATVTRDVLAQQLRQVHDSGIAVEPVTRALAEVQSP